MTMNYGATLDKLVEMAKTADETNRHFLLVDIATKYRVAHPFVSYEEAATKARELVFSE